MRNVIMLSAAALAMGVMLGAGPAGAKSPSQQDCEDAGGTFTREKGTVTCTMETTTNVGNSPNSQTVTITDVEESKGTFQNAPKHQESSTCSGPGNSGDNSAHCN